MSQNPFTQPGNPNQGHYSYPGSGQPVPPQSPKGDNTVKTVLIILAIIAVVVMLICGGIAVMGYLAVNRMANEFKAEFEAAALEYGEQSAEPVRDAVGTATELVAEVGDVREITYDPARSSATDQEGIEWFRVVGSKGEGSLRADYAYEEGRMFKSITLVTSDGREIPLTLAPIPYSDDTDRDVWIAVRDHLPLKTAIGNIKTVSYEPLDDEPDDIMRYSITGEQGQAIAIVRYDDEGNISSVELTFPDGSKTTIQSPAGG